MNELLWKRILYKDFKTLAKRVLTYLFCFSITLAFILFMVAIAENEVGEWLDCNFDILVMDFDRDSISEIQKQPSVEETYVSKCGYATIERNGKKQDTEMILVDRWDTSGISFLGVGRKEYGKINNLLENGIILDVMTARKIGAGVGDLVKVEMDDTELEYEVMMLIKPDFLNRGGTSVCLYNYYIRSALSEKNREMYDSFDSYLFVKTVDGNLDYFISDYVGPYSVSPGNVGQERTELMQDTINNLIYTPPVLIAMCILGMVLLLCFIWREYSLFIEDNARVIIVLHGAGYAPGKIIRKCGAYLFGIMSVTIIFSGMITKCFYDLFIHSYYISWRTYGMVVGAGIVLMIVMMFGISIVQQCLYCYRSDEALSKGLEE